MSIIKLKYNEYIDIKTKDEKYIDLIDYYFPTFFSLEPDGIGFFDDDSCEVTQDKTYFEKYGLDLFKITILENATPFKIGLDLKKVYYLKINPHKYNLGIIEYIRTWI